MASQLQFFADVPVKGTKCSRVPLMRFEDVQPCTVCGDRIGPWWHRAGARLCRKHAPADLRREAE
jgi:hypothetical protein